MKYLQIVKNWIITKWNGNSWDRFILGLSVLALTTALAVLFG